MRRLMTVLLVLPMCVVFAWAQAPDDALKDRVNQLVERLDSPKNDVRDTAEKTLIGLGSKVLPLLPDLTKTTSKERKERIERIRTALAEAEQNANLGASRVTIQAKGIRLSEAIRQLQAKTGNAITDLREQFGTEVTNPSLELDIADKPFFEALDIIAKKADLVPSFFTSDGTIGLMAVPMMREGEDKPAENPFLIYSGPFRVVFKQIFVSRDLQADTGTANAQFEVAWEPRLRPMLLALKVDEIKIVDDQGKEVKPAVMQESTELPLRPENPAAEVNL